MRQRGTTLYELLMTLLLVAIIAGLALPSFATSIARQRQRVEIDALFHAVHVARKESIMRRRVVSLCPSTGGLRCSGSTDWSAGWILFANHDRDDPPEIDAGEPLLSVHRAGDSIRITANRRGFTLRSTEQRATNGTLVFCDTEGRIPPKALVVSYTGRPRVADRSASGRAYACAD